MNNIIKIWVITIITVVTALLLPSIITYAEETERQPLDRFYYWHVTNKDLGTGELDIHKGWHGYDGTDSELKSFSVIMHTNVYGSGKVPATVHYCVVYNNTNKDLVHAFNKNKYSTQVIKSGKYIIDLVGEVMFEPIRIYQSNATYYIDYEDEPIDIDGFIKSIMGGTIPADTTTLNPDFVWDEELQDYVNPNVKYDLEIVKGIEVTIPDTKIVNDMLLEDYVIKWKPSDEFRKEDYFREVETEIYQIQCGRIKEYPWSDWKEFRFEPQLISYPFAYKEYWKGGGNNGEWQAFKDAYYNGFLNIGILASSYDTWDIDLYTSDFLIRYRYLDDNNVMHYSSNFAFVQCKSDGTYTISIPDTDDIDDVEPDSPTIEVPDYTDEIIISKDDDIEVTNIFSTIKALFNTLKDFPTYFGKIFNMFPAWLITLMSFGIGALIIIGILKAVL